MEHYLIELLRSRGYSVAKDTESDDFFAKLVQAITVLAELIKSTSPDLELGAITIHEKSAHARFALGAHIKNGKAFTPTYAHDGQRPSSEISTPTRIQGTRFVYSRTPGKFNLYEEIERETGINRDVVKKLLYLSPKLRTEVEETLAARISKACREMRSRIPELL